VRGHLNNAVIAFLRGGSIPTCAGASVYKAVLSSEKRVYPHVCGGIATRRSASPTRIGLSPRVRGHRDIYQGAIEAAGSIPTCAGASRAGAGAAGGSTVYPHVCGGIRYPQDTIHKVKGLSPRVRGHHHFKKLEEAGYRSIPTCAGASSARGCNSYNQKVYPHVCGGILGVCAHTL